MNDVNVSSVHIAYITLSLINVYHLFGNCGFVFYGNLTVNERKSHLKCIFEALKAQQSKAKVLSFMLLHVAYL